MIPLVGEERAEVRQGHRGGDGGESKGKKGSDIAYHIGTMIEIPRARCWRTRSRRSGVCFSFGTNDLTQMTFGFSRDDAGKFLDAYYKAKIYESDPFARLDLNGVGQLVEMAAEGAEDAPGHRKLGICGEHGGDPSSVEFCQKGRAGLRVLQPVPCADRTACGSAGCAINHRKTA